MRRTTGNLPLTNGLPLSISTLIIIAAALLAPALTACSGSTVITQREGSIQASRELASKPFAFDMAPAGGNHVIVMRRPANDTVLLERYDDTLGRRWSVRLDIPTSEQEMYFLGGFYVYIDRELIDFRRSLYCDGQVAGFLYLRRTSYDSVRLMGVLSDAATGRKIKEEELDRHPRDRDFSARVQRGFRAISPDGSKIALFGYDYSGITNRGGKKSVAVSGRIISSKFEPLGDFTFDIPFSEETYDIEDTEPLLRGAMVDDQGNFYQPAIDKTKLQVVQYNLAARRARSVTTFTSVKHDDDDAALARASLLEPTSNGVIACAALMDDDVVAGLAHARIDFAAGTSSNEWYYPISEEVAESLTDDDELDDFVLDKVAIAKNGTVAYSLEQQKYYVAGDAFNRQSTALNVLQYEHKNIALLAFSPDGKLLRSSGIAKEDKTGGSKSFTQRLGDDGVLRVIYSILGETIYLHELPITSGTPATKELAQIEYGNFFMMLYDVWLSDKVVLLHSATEKGMLLTKMKLP